MAKKLFALLLSLVLCFVITGCKNEESTDLSSSITDKIESVVQSDANDDDVDTEKDSPPESSSKNDKDDNKDDIEYKEDDDIDDPVSGTAIDTVEDEAYYDYATVVSGIWVAKNYEDPSYPHIYCFNEFGTIFTDLDEYYDSDPDTVTDYSWGLSDDPDLVKGFEDNAEMYDLYPYYSDYEGENRLYASVPTYYSDEADTCPAILSAGGDTLRIFHDDGSYMCFYKIPSDKAGYLLRDTVYDGQFDNPTVGYMTLGDEPDSDGNFTVILNELLWIGWNDIDLMNDFDLTYDDMSNDYELVELGERIEFDANDNTTFTVIDWDSDFFDMADVDADRFIELLNEYSQYQYDYGMLVEIECSDYYAISISEIYVP